MLPLSREGTALPTLVLLHYFGGSRREWTEVRALLSPHFECVSLDLPGFGDSADIIGYTVEEMTAAIAKTIKFLALKSFVLVGHSMTGKLALVIAAQKLAGLKGLVLVAPSPPSPEPIQESNRKKMLAFRRVRQDAEEFLDGITAHPLVGEARERAIKDFMRCSPDAWTAWLERGSKENCAKHVNIVGYPALVITGDADPSLPASVQEKMTLPHLKRPRLEVISQCGHLPTLETPGKLSWLISNFVRNEVKDPSDPARPELNGH